MWRMQERCKELFSGLAGLTYCVAALLISSLEDWWAYKAEGRL